MENSLNIPKFPNANARMTLAKRLNLTYHENMQDWEYEVADISRIDDFLETYLCEGSQQDERFILMEMLLESFTEVNDLDGDKRWLVTLSLLKKNINIHAYTICYWSSSKESLENCWNVTPYLRKIYDKYNLKNIDA